MGPAVVVHYYDADCHDTGKKANESLMVEWFDPRINGASASPVSDWVSRHNDVFDVDAVDLCLAFHFAFDRSILRMGGRA